MVRVQTNTVGVASPPLYESSYCAKRCMCVKGHACINVTIYLFKVVQTFGDVVVLQPTTSTHYVLR